MFALLIHSFFTLVSLLCAIFLSLQLRNFIRGTRRAAKTLDNIEGVALRLDNLERGQDKHSDRFAVLNGKYGALMAKLKEGQAQSVGDDPADEVGGDAHLQRELLFQKLAEKQKIG